MADAVSSDRPIRPSGVIPEKNALALVCLFLALELSVDDRRVDRPR